MIEDRPSFPSSPFFPRTPEPEPVNPFADFDDEDDFSLAEIPEEPNGWIPQPIIDPDDLFDDGEDEDDARWISRTRERVFPGKAIPGLYLSDPSGGIPFSPPILRCICPFRRPFGLLFFTSR